MNQLIKIDNYFTRTYQVLGYGAMTDTVRITQIHRENDRITRVVINPISKQLGGGSEGMTANEFIVRVMNGKLKPIA
jgi:hypothetical protein